jgi:hypothetical protein
MAADCNEDRDRTGIQLIEFLVVALLEIDISRSLDPLIWIMGKPLVVALATATKPFKNPGADTVRQIPGF